MDIGTLIVSTPGIVGGRPRVAGTGISVDQLTSLWVHGLSPEKIVTEKYPQLSLAQMYAALAYYHANRDVVDASLSATARAYEDWRAEENTLERRLRPDPLKP